MQQGLRMLQETVVFFDQARARCRDPDRCGQPRRPELPYAGKTMYYVNEVAYEGHQDQAHIDGGVPVTEMPRAAHLRRDSVGRADLLLRVCVRRCPAISDAASTRSTSPASKPTRPTCSRCLASQATKRNKESNAAPRSDDRGAFLFRRIAFAGRAYWAVCRHILG